MSQTIIVTIDGPAASGKSSLSRELARRFGWGWVSTGAFYRGLAYLAWKVQAPLNDEKRLLQLVSDPSWEVRMSTEQTKVFWMGHDVTDEIGREEIGTLASRISQFPSVRLALLVPQRACAHGAEGLIAEGRDCGTIVFPDAQIKIFLTASSENRAARRALDEGKPLDETHSAQQQRDARDATRKAAPMSASADSHLIDTSNMNLDEVVQHVETLIRASLPK